MNTSSNDQEPGSSNRNQMGSGLSQGGASGNAGGDSPDRGTENASIFMTSMPNTAGQGHESKESIVEYTRLFHHLMSLAENIDSHYRKQLRKHEDDFKRAYECQMQKVRKELEFLKMKQNEANGALMNDDRITSLRKWIKWFKTKSIELDAQLNMQKRQHIKQKQEQASKVKNNALLKNCLKESMKQNKALQAAVKRQHTQNEKLKAFLIKNNVSLASRPSAENSTSQVNQNASDNQDHFSNDLASQIIKSAPTEQNQEGNEDSDEPDEMIAIDDGGDQVDIKIPKTFLTQNQKDNDDLIFEVQSTALPQTKEEYREFRKMAKFNLKKNNQDLVLQQQDNLEPSIAPAIEHLCMKNLKNETVEEQIVSFFRAFDEYKED